MQILFSSIRIYWLQLTVILLATITTLSLLPLEQLPDAPGGDKLHHLVAYAALMLPVALRKPRGWLWLGLAFILWSGGIELIQPYVNRYGEWLDLLANAAGIFSGTLIAMLVNRFAAD
ncbi:MAG: VanZ family protein [Gammaproteobacteria bacterium]|nr:VanZ family protein [Gammaproteobacteria bacterium]